MKDGPNKEEQLQERAAEKLQEQAAAVATLEHALPDKHHRKGKKKHRQNISAEQPATFEYYVHRSMHGPPLTEQEQLEKRRFLEGMRDESLNGPS